MSDDATFSGLTDAILDLPRGNGRRLVAVAGPPASGKSTVAVRLAEAVTAAGRRAMVVPMDGFHMDNPDLIERGLLDRKGAPETFDLEGFSALVHRLAKGGDVTYPTFDRAADRVVPGAGLVPESCDIAILEGNYLLFDEPGWRDLPPVWDLSIWVEVPLPVLRARLIARWQRYGFPQDAARRRAEGNDLPNAMRVVAGRIDPNFIHLNG